MRTAYHDTVGYWNASLRLGLEEDAWQWDWTTLGTLGRLADKRVKAAVVAKSDGVWAGDGALKAVEGISAALGMPVRTVPHARDGARIRKGARVCEWTGPARAVLALERPFLNLVSYAGGIATATRALVDAVGGAWESVPRRDRAGFEPPRVTATRKTLPGLRDVAVASVIAGGGRSHRLNLAGGVLIKENHVAAAGSIERAIRSARASAPHGLKVEAEVRDHRELMDAVRAGADGVLLDNFEPAEVARAVASVRRWSKPGSLFVEVSGGIRAENVGRYVRPGVHVISSGGLTHSVQALDLSLLIG